MFLAAAVWLPNASLATAAATCAAIFALLREVAWRVYVGNLRRVGAPARSLDVLQAFTPSLLIGGAVLPLVLIVAGALIPIPAPLLFTAAGLIGAATGVALKFMLVTRASYNQGFALEHTPVRGSGTAGPGVKPGWAYLK